MLLFGFYLSIPPGLGSGGGFLGWYCGICSCYDGVVEDSGRLVKVGGCLVAMSLLSGIWVASSLDEEVEFVTGCSYENAYQCKNK